MSKPIAIIGCGPGARSLLTIEAIDAVAAADVIVGAPRVLALFPDSQAERITLDSNLAVVLDTIAKRRKRGAIAVLVTGDPGVHSLARPVIERFGLENCRVIPGIGSVQLALARLGLDATKTRILSAHHRLPDIDSAELTSFETIAILTGHESAHPWIQSLAETLTNDYRIVLLSNLGLQNECIEELTGIQGGHRDPPRHTLSVVILTRRSDNT